MLTFCCDEYILTEDASSVIVIIMLHGILNLNLPSSCQKFNISTFCTLKYPLQNQYNTSVYHIIASVVFLVKFFSFLLFNPSIVNGKTT